MRPKRQAANIDGSFQGSAAISMCLGSFTLSNDLAEVLAALNFRGSSSGDLHVKFVPLDIVGHLTCQVPWTEDQKVSATVPQTILPLRAKIGLSAVDGEARYTFAIDEASRRLWLNPGPTEFMLKSTNMTLARQGLNLVKPLIIPATAFVPELPPLLRCGSGGSPEPKQHRCPVNLKMPSITSAGNEALCQRQAIDRSLPFEDRKMPTVGRGVSPRLRIFHKARRT